MTAARNSRAILLCRLLPQIPGPVVIAEAGGETPAAIVLKPILQVKCDRHRIWHRMQRTGQGRMPHIASNVVDEEAVKLIGEWIKQLPKEK